MKDLIPNYSQLACVPSLSFVYALLFLGKIFTDARFPGSYRPRNLLSVSQSHEGHYLSPRAQKLIISFPKLTFWKELPPPRDASDFTITRTSFLNKHADGQIKVTQKT